jgi:hypothetical protein
MVSASKLLGTGTQRRASFRFCRVKGAAASVGRRLSGMFGTGRASLLVILVDEPALRGRSS